MSLTDNSILAELKASGNLPSPTGIALTILEMARDPLVSTDELANVLQGDPALTGQILKYANSADSGARVHVIALRDALIRLGLAQVRQLCLSFSILANARSGPCAAFDYERYWTRSLAMAVSCQSISRLVRSLNPDEGFTCGLLAHIGRLAMASVYPDDYAEILARWNHGAPEELAEFEKSMTGLTHTDAAAAILEDWRLPPHVITAARCQEDGSWITGAAVPPSSDRGRQLGRVLHAAGLAADICVENGPRRHLMVLGFLKAGLSLGFEEMPWISMYDEILAEWERMGGVLDIVTAHVPSLETLVQKARAQGEVIDDRARTRGPATSGPAMTAPRRPRASGPAVAATVGPDTQAVTASATPVQDAATATAEPAQEPGLDILIATDSAIEMTVLTRKLTQLGHRITCATDGRQALEMALKTAPQLILSDWMLPKLDGLELCRMLRSSPQTQGVYYIINTSNDTGAELVEGFEAGINDYVVKPLNHRILAARLRGASQVIRLREQSLRDREEMRRQLSHINKLNRKLESLAMEDQLTGLPNRRAGLEFLDETWSRATRTGESMLVMLLDIDHFKKVNDTWGHDAGDVVLQRTATAMRGAVRDYDKVSRYGGEEFLVVCPGADVQFAHDIGNRIRESVEKNRIESAVFTGSVTISIGVSVRGPEHQSTRELLREADEALYAAKDAGRNKVCIQAPVEP
ncbi:MAG: diguanylate cyclase [bacterium]|nr:diguanylate cyclase [bacterium]